MRELIVFMQRPLVVEYVRYSYMRCGGSTNCDNYSTRFSQAQAAHTEAEKKNKTEGNGNFAM